MSRNTLPSIYIDLDDVLCDTAGAYIDLVKKEFDKDFVLEDIHSFNLRDSFQLSHDENEHMFKCAHKPDFTLSLAPFSDIVPALNQLQKKYSLSIVTGRHTSAHKESLEWLRMHEIPFDSFTMVDKYSWPKTDPALAISLEKLTNMRFSFAIEDNPEMVHYLSKTMQTNVILFNRPWNTNIVGGNGVKRCNNWREISAQLAFFP